VLRQTENETPNRLHTGPLVDTRSHAELLEFDDLFAVHRACPDSLGPAGPALADLDRALDRMSGEANAHSWTDQALKPATEWHEVRALATLALALLPEA
jgi:hypothetical protein